MVVAPKIRARERLVFGSYNNPVVAAIGKRMGTSGAREFPDENGYCLKNRRTHGRMGRS